MLYVQYLLCYMCHICWSPTCAICAIFARQSERLAAFIHSSSSSLISSSLHSHVAFCLEWYDTIKLSNLRLPRKIGTIKSLQLLSTSTVRAARCCCSRPLPSCRTPNPSELRVCCLGIRIQVYVSGSGCPLAAHPTLLSCGFADTG